MYFSAYNTSVCVISVALLLILSVSDAKLREGECEVCVDFIQKFSDQLDSSRKTDAAKVEEDFKKYCKKATGKQERFCYYVGGLETSATYMVQEVSKPVSWSMPADKVCEKLKSKDAQICELRFGVTKDLKNKDLTKMRVKDLKNILQDWGEKCKGCTEKNDYIARIQELMPKYIPNTEL